MSSRPPRLPFCSIADAPVSSVLRVDFVPLREDAATDDMIRAMRDHARGVTGARVTPELVLECAKALRHPATCITEREAERRRAARRACVLVINARAARWLEYGNREDRLYAQLAGLIPQRPRAAGTRVRATGLAARHPLCWECNDPITTGRHRDVRVRGGMVSVHLGCIDDIDDDALDEDTGVYPVPGIGTGQGDGHDGEGELAEDINRLGDDERQDRRWADHNAAAGSQAVEAGAADDEAEL